MSAELKLTTPKSFVFVLMPFREDFNDIYKFGIKGAAEEVGAYAERVDEQMYTEGILERIYNQINKADVIVADMTGQNPNVFYEVGYAHALGKIVILLTQRAEDIPFDLVHRPHIVYGGMIDTLRTQLASRLAWAIGEAKRLGSQFIAEQLDVLISSEAIPEGVDFDKAPVLPLKFNTATGRKSFRVKIRNSSAGTTPAITHTYLFSSLKSKLVLIDTNSPGKHVLKPFVAHPVDAKDGLKAQYRLKVSIPALPPGAVEDFSIMFSSEKLTSEVIESFRLRLLSPASVHDFPFKIKAYRESPQRKAPTKRK